MSAGILVSLYTGLRIGELCALTWDQINLEEGFLSVNKTIQRIYLQDEGNSHATKVIISEPKTRNAQRDIPLSNQLIQILNRLVPCQKDGVNFLTHEKESTVNHAHTVILQTCARRMWIAPNYFSCLSSYICESLCGDRN